MSCLAAFLRPAAPCPAPPSRGTPRGRRGAWRAPVCLRWHRPRTSAWLMAVAPVFPQCLVVGSCGTLASRAHFCDGATVSLHFFLGSTRIFLLVTRGSGRRRRPDFAPRPARVSGRRGVLARGPAAALDDSRLAATWEMLLRLRSNRKENYSELVTQSTVCDPCGILPEAVHTGKWKALGIFMKKLEGLEQRS